MRFIIHEQLYEKPISSGEYRYFLNAQATGAVERWRLTQAVDGYTFLRVDLDARAAQSGHTYLYHAVVNGKGLIERLKYRFWDRTSQLQVVGDLVVEESAVAATRTVNSQTFSTVLDKSDRDGIWFPALTGLGFVVRLVGNNPLHTITLNNQVGDNETLAVKPIDIKRELLNAEQTEETIAGQTMQIKNWRISWKNNQRLLTTDENGWPLRLERGGLDGDGRLTAVATRLIHTQRIT